MQEHTGKEDAVQKLKAEALAVVSMLAAVAVGGLVFVTAMMPFVFPAVLVAAVVYLWRRDRRARRVHDLGAADGAGAPGEKPRGRAALAA
ncbi:MAG TPA: hypothetical protein VF904_09590 [Anaeromyxobacteraceae bacterium]